MLGAKLVGAHRIEEVEREGEVVLVLLHARGRGGVALDALYHLPRQPLGKQRQRHARRQQVCATPSQNEAEFRRVSADGRRPGKARQGKADVRVPLTVGLTDSHVLWQHAVDPGRETSDVLRRNLFRSCGRYPAIASRVHGTLALQHRLALALFPLARLALRLRKAL